MHQPKIRVLHVLPWITAGGVERRRAAIAEQSGDAFEHQFFTFVANGESADRMRAAGCVIHEASVSRLTGTRPFIELARVVRAYKPHIIHGAVFEGVILAATVGRAMRVPIVLGEETSDATNRSWRGHGLFRALAMATDRTVAISPQVMEKLQTLTGIPAHKIQLIVNGVEPFDEVSDAGRAQAKKSFSLPEDAFILGTMSRLVDDSHKRVSDLIRAISIIRQDLPNAHVLVCGKGRDKPMLEQLAQDLGVAEHVTFAGTVKPAEGFAAMDVFVHVAQREGFGLCVAEAAFCGLPTVTTGVGGIAEIVVPDTTASIVPVGDPPAIAKAVLALAKDSELRARYGAAARKRAVERFSVERYVRDIDAFYHALIEEKQVRV